MSSTMEVAKKLVDLCRKGKSMEVINTMYSPNIVSIEPQASPTGPARSEGLAAIKGKNEWWMKNHEIHKAEVAGPWPHGDRFIVRFTYEVTPKEGPMAGKRMTMDETGLYTVKGDKITQEEFFYHMGG
jgi:SnoaL-like domain